MSSKNFVKSGMASVFLMDTCGSRAQWQGCLRVSGLTRGRGAITSHYCRTGEDIREVVGRTRAAPEAIKPTVEAPSEILWSWLHRVCAFTMVVGWKKCASQAEVTKWDAQFDRLMYLPEAEIETDEFTESVTMGLDDDSAITGQRASLHVDDWILWERHDVVQIGEDETWAGGSDDILAAAYCGGPLCGACATTCVQPYDAGCETIWLGGEAGFLYLSVDGGVTWTNKQGVGAGQLDLSDLTYTLLDVTALYCDRDVVIVATEDGCMHYSHDGGTVWTTLAACPYMTVAFAEYLGTIFAVGNGIWYSTDNGVTWTQIQEGAFLDIHMSTDGVGVAITATATYLSQVGGLAWSTITASGLAGQNAVQRVDCRIWVMGSDGASYTNDEGTTWVAVDTDAWTNFLFLNCYVGYRLAASAETNDMELTLDGGHTWWALAVGGIADEELTQIIACYDRLLVAGEEGFAAQLVLFERMIE